eukprot:GHRQ01029820.1.p2 GENE.GHRQ01029820.1~~GHRQ01029820.1.p2  ORF type:complete len:134 (+),score=39.57 GHRQ01029820.1:269-670(+)
MKHPHHVGTTEELKTSLAAAGCWDSYAEQYCDEGCLKRYLRARNMDVTKACAMLKTTLEWRKTNKIDDMTIEEFASSRYMRDGWVYVDGNDAEGRSIVVSRLETPAAVTAAALLLLLLLSLTVACTGGFVFGV